MSEIFRVQQCEIRWESELKYVTQVTHVDGWKISEYIDVIRQKKIFLSFFLFIIAIDIFVLFRYFQSREFQNASAGDLWKWISRSATSVHRPRRSIYTGGSKSNAGMYIKRDTREISIFIYDFPTICLGISLSMRTVCRRYKSTERKELLFPHANLRIFKSGCVRWFPSCHECFQVL